MKRGRGEGRTSTKDHKTVVGGKQWTLPMKRGRGEGRTSTKDHKTVVGGKQWTLPMKPCSKDLLIVTDVVC